MAREIKFRAYRKDWGQIITPTAEELGTLIHHPDLNQDFVLMQFTGLKDKSGKEIYEGDIIQNSAKVTWWIEWDDGKARWAYRRGGISTQAYPRTWFGLTYSSAIKSEVIGNIYENPELLTDKK